ncbi:putative isomerase YraM [Kitasatospora xanthocidica]|uniref:PrpF domain-containing protein n=1 Tax=Kitasatospora xanthocidica TaxID=83382 RepID=UPI0016793C01|nr:PrpF domain-containing protein [Kitasatospora xanthocidica]GHF67287.1 putative isomerase YraM [Kitasatospora xanthocidica]
MLRLQGEMIRGGTSKCWIFDERDVAATGVDLDTLLLAAFNAADPRQIDGVGGASSTTSKAAVVRASDRADVDVEYAFAQVGIGDERVEWGSNCGNCATAVALYAVHNDLVPITSDSTTVRMLNINTGARLTGTIPTPAGVVPEEGTATVPGTSAPGVPVLLGFHDPAGSSTGRALPTGRALDELTGPGGPVEASLVDAGAPAALFEAKAFGLDGTASLTAFATVVPALTLLRRQAALAMGLAREQDPVSHAVPKVGIVARPAPYRTTQGILVDQDEYDLAVRMVSMHAPHPAIGLTSAVALATAASTPGTLAHRVARQTADGTLRLGTPAGVITTRAVPAPDSASPTVLLHRAARRIARAELLVPVLEGRPA